MQIFQDEHPTPLLDVVRIVCLSDMQDKVLLVRESDDPNWKLPGGKVHEGESVLETLQRELVEELGLRLNPDMIIKYLKATIPHSENFRYIFLLDIDAASINTTTEVERWDYFSLQSLPDTKFSEHILSAVELIKAA